MEEAGEEGLLLQPAFPAELPEFVRVYNRWLEQEAGVSPLAPLRIALYAHASNGGIRIGADASTGGAGLYAAGECTGGMHGAYRLGGLSTANCLVFGMRAGEHAARWASQGGSGAACTLPEWTALACEAAGEAERAMRRLMDTHCMAPRTQAGLEVAVGGLAALKGAVESDTGAAASPAAAAERRRVQLRLQTAAAMAGAALRRPESCGSHCMAG